jgi:RimJ/RimL family protein N-acetyltransferase
MAALDMTLSFWRGPRIRLRALATADASAWLEADTDTEAVRLLNLGVTPPKSPAQAMAWVERFAEFNNADERIFFSIETHAGDYIGNINIGTMDHKNGIFSTGTRLFAAHRGNGYALEAKRIVLRYAFHELRFQKYNLRCLETNAAIIRHATLLGCREEGRLRRNIFTDGRFYDELCFGLTREEFDAAEAAPPSDPPGTRR